MEVAPLTTTGTMTVYDPVAHTWYVECDDKKHVATGTYPSYKVRNCVASVGLHVRLEYRAFGGWYVVGVVDEAT